MGLDEIGAWIKVRITFLEEALGGLPSSTEILAQFIASKSPDKETIADEIEAVGVEGVLEKTMTVFPRDSEGNLCFYDYQIKGAFKDACGALTKVEKTKSYKMKAYKKNIDQLIFVYPRMIPIVFKGYPGDCQRPLRTSGPQGDRTALAMSETVPAGAYLECEIFSFREALMPVVEEWLSYFKFRGLSQWRNSGKGRATWERLGDAKQEGGRTGRKAA